MVVAGTTASAGNAAAESNGNGVINGDVNDKQTICHRTDDDKKPYVVETPNKNGDVSGHAATSVDGEPVKNGHGGPVWNPTLKDDHIKWGDIIPPFDFNDNGVTRHFDGQNYDTFGKLFFANDCNVPTPALTIGIVKVNNADGNGTFGKDETAPAAAFAVPFKITVTNTSIVPVTINSFTDKVGVTPLPTTCLTTTSVGHVTFADATSLVGATLDPAASVTCSFTLPAYSPGAGGALVNTATVVVSQAAGPNLPADSENTTSAQDTSTVRSPEIVIVTPTTPPATTAPPTTAPPTTAPPTTAPPTTAPPTTAPPTTAPPTTAPPTTAPPTTAPPTTAPPTTAPPTTAPPTTAPPTTAPPTTAPPTTAPPESPQTAPDLAVVKTGPATASPGDTISWTLTVTNTGDATASTASLSDALPEGIAFVSGTGLGWSCTSTTEVSCTSSQPLAAGASSQVTIVGTIGADFTDNSFTNTAVVEPADTTPADNTSSATTTLVFPTTGGGGGGDVTGPGAPSTGGGGGGVTLPVTGAPIGLMMLAGQTLFAFGGMMLLLGRRRRA